MKVVDFGTLKDFIVHYVGNKNHGDGVSLSELGSDFESIQDHIVGLLKSSFRLEELYQFHFDPGLELHPTYQFISSIFQDNSSFIDQSQNLGRFLYDNSNHPQIKAGELCVVYLKDCQLDGNIADCIAIFKSEEKDTILKVSHGKKSIDLIDEIGISTKNIDKGCLVFNLEKESGFQIFVVDNSKSKNGSQFWKDDFLKIRLVKDEFNQTNSFLNVVKKIITNDLNDENGFKKPDKIDLLDRSMEYFKTNDSFSKSDFEEKVLKVDRVIEKFCEAEKKYTSEPFDNFKISSDAVNKQKKLYKSIVKLDKNFHIYIHGGRDLIEHGIDEQGRKFYKIYYQDES